MSSTLSGLLGGQLYAGRSELIRVLVARITQMPPQPAGPVPLSHHDAEHP